MAKSIQHRFFYTHPPEVVWDYITKADLMELWLMKSDFEPILGYDFQFIMKPIPALDLDGIFYCKVLEIIPFKKLSYSWKGGPGNGKLTLDSVVIWELHAKDNGTELFLDHSGFSELANLQLYNGMNGGWLSNIKKIAELIKAKEHGPADA